VNENDPETNNSSPSEVSTHEAVRYVSLGSYLRTVRIGSGLNKSQLASSAGVHPSIVTRIESGQTESLHGKNLERIVAALQIPHHVVSDLMARPRVVVDVASSVSRVRMGAGQSACPHERFTSRLDDCEVSDEQFVESLCDLVNIKNSDADGYVRAQAASLIRLARMPVSNR
jgi:hypothetical protein